MNNQKVYTAIGLMSGTSLDGEIDVALLETDGHAYVKALDFRPYPYERAVRDKVRSCFGKYEHDTATREAEELVTALHIEAVKSSGFQADVIGFHGQTLTHDPAKNFTWQIGDGAVLARETGMSVVCDMRRADMEAGGQGAPLIPLYHKALAAGRPKPLAILNIGGVANVTYVAEDGTLLAFDTGPGGALLDDYISAKTGRPFDKGGALAQKGRASKPALETFSDSSYFQIPPPKSLDRNNFLSALENLPEHVGDAAATLMAFTVHGVAKAQEHFPAPPQEWLICGGGRRNTALMEELRRTLDAPVLAIEEAGWNGDAIEAQGFAYLAVRALLGLPLTLPSTTGAPGPLTGGALFRP